MSVETIDPDPTRWHAGNIRMHNLMSVPPPNNPSTPYLPQNRALFLPTCPLIALGVLDKEGRPWTTLWGGERGLVTSLGDDNIGTTALVDRKWDPVIELLGEGREQEDLFGRGSKISALAIDLENRRRLKVAGEVLGALFSQKEQTGGSEDLVGEVQLVFKVESSLRNCPKYLNKMAIIPTLPIPSLDPQTLPLPPSATFLISQASLFFMTSAAQNSHHSTNHRGGPPGFLRVVTNTPTTTQLAYPEYSGNRLYQTLGNLQINPQAGLVIPDFHTGDVLHATATASILVGSAATALIPRSNLVLVFTLTAARLVHSALGVRAIDGEFSPYNPPVRYLASEKPPSNATTQSTSKGGPPGSIHATLVERTILTPTIARLRFETDSDVTWTRGQHVALGFETELGVGYSHMRDDDPQSLNDDLVRTFTVSAAAPSPSSSEPKRIGTRTFEVTVRNVGDVTGHLFRAHVRGGVQAEVVGFGGEFRIEQEDGEVVAFVAGGVGITPLLGQTEALDHRRIQLWWSVRAADLDFVEDVMRGWEEKAPFVRVFVSGDVDGEAEVVMKRLEHKRGVIVKRRRIEEGDFEVGRASEGKVQDVRRWYVCAGKELTGRLEKWLDGWEVVTENFDY